MPGLNAWCMTVSRGYSPLAQGAFPLFRPAHRMDARLAGRYAEPKRLPTPSMTSFQMVAAVAAHRGQTLYVVA